MSEAGCDKNDPKVLSVFKIMGSNSKRSNSTRSAAYIHFKAPRVGESCCVEVKFIFTVNTPVADPDGAAPDGSAPDPEMRMQLLAFIQRWQLEYVDGLVMTASRGHRDAMIDIQWIREPVGLIMDCEREYIVLHEGNARVPV